LNEVFVEKERKKFPTRSMPRFGKFSNNNRKKKHKKVISRFKESWKHIRIIKRYKQRNRYYEKN